MFTRVYRLVLVHLPYYTPRDPSFRPVAFAESSYYFGKKPHSSGANWNWVGTEGKGVMGNRSTHVAAETDLIRDEILTGLVQESRGFMRFKCKNTSTRQNPHDYRLHDGGRYHESRVPRLTTVRTRVGSFVSGDGN